MKYTKQIGRKPKKDPCIYRYVVYFNAVDNAKFSARFDQSGLRVKSHFISACIFEKQLKVIKIDKATMDYYMRLTNFHSQFRAIGVNYDLIAKKLKATFTVKSALAMLFRLEKATIELVRIHKQVLLLTDEFERKHLNNTGK